MYIPAWLHYRIASSPIVATQTALSARSLPLNEGTKARMTAPSTVALRNRDDTRIFPTAAASLDYARGCGMAVGRAMVEVVDVPP